MGTEKLHDRASREPYQSDDDEGTSARSDSHCRPTRAHTGPRRTQGETRKALGGRSEHSFQDGTDFCSSGCPLNRCSRSCRTRLCGVASIADCGLLNSGFDVRAMLFYALAPNSAKMTSN